MKNSSNALLNVNNNKNNLNGQVRSSLDQQSPVNLMGTLTINNSSRKRSQARKMSDQRSQSNFSAKGNNNHEIICDDFFSSRVDT